MSGERRLFLDRSPGEERGVVLLDGLPERLLIARDGEPPFAALGAAYIGRARAVGAGRAFVELPHGPPGFLADAPRDLPEGAAIEATVAAEARGDKGPRLMLVARGEGPPRLLRPAPDLPARLGTFAPGASIVDGDAARETADMAEEAALAPTHGLKGGVRLTIETTRALTAIDVDAAPATPAAKRQELNLRAIRHAARLLRLKSVGGTVVIDLAGFPRAAGLMAAEAERAFAADGPGVTVLAPDRLGLLRLAKPHGLRPVAERLLDAEGRLSAETVAHRTARAALRAFALRPGRALGRDRRARRPRHPLPAPPRPAHQPARGGWGGARDDRYPPGMTDRPCPICGKPASPERRPFCSSRCADLDLQRWLSGRYAIPGSEEPAADDDA